MAWTLKSVPSRRLATLLRAAPASYRSSVKAMWCCGRPRNSARRSKASLAPSSGPSWPSTFFCSSVGFLLSPPCFRSFFPGCAAGAAESSFFPELRDQESPEREEDQSDEAGTLVTHARVSRGLQPLRRAVHEVGIHHCELVN